MKFFNKLFILLLFLNLSETYKLILFSWGIPSVVTSVATVVLLLLYILFNLNTLSVLARVSFFKYWFILVFLIPTVSISINYFRGNLNETELTYWLAFNALFSFLFVSSAIVAYSVPLKWLVYMVWACVCSTIIGFYVYYAYPDLIRQMGTLTGNQLAFVVYGSEESRNMSFFDHPNGAALSIVCYFIFLFTSFVDSTKSIAFYVFCSALLLAMVSLTGSRTSLVISIALIIVYIRPLIGKIISLNYRHNSGQVKLIIYAFLTFGVFFGVLLLYLISGSITSHGFSEVESRYSIFSSLFDPSKDLKDESLDERTTIVGVYLKYVSDNILLGYGPVFRDNKIGSGQLKNVSQNAYLEGALVYGIFYPIYFIYIKIKTYIAAKNKLYKNHFIFNSLAVFMVFLFLLSLSVNDIFWNRSIVIVLGLLIGIYIRHRSEKSKVVQPPSKQAQPGYLELT